MALAYQEGTLLKRRGTELMKGTYPCEISSAASRGENCPHKAEDSTEEKGNSQHTRMSKEYWCRLFYGLNISLPLDKQGFINPKITPLLISAYTVLQMAVGDPHSADKMESLSHT